MFQLGVPIVVVDRLRILDFCHSLEGLYSLKMDLGSACQRKPPSIAFLAMEREPRAFFRGAVSELLGREVLVLDRVVLGCAGLILAAVGGGPIRT